MTTFNRGLDDKFVERLNDEYNKGGWWSALVSDKDLFVAIRHNRVNVYYRGCSLAEIQWWSGEVVVRTHYKYLLRPSLRNPYIEFADGTYGLPQNLREWFVQSPKKVKDLKSAARHYAGEEKTGVQRIIEANPNILDVEIAFGLSETEEASASAPRMDFAALQGSEVVFFEAKRFANSELRAKSGNRPKVVRQLETYSALLEENRDAITDSYGCVCCNLRHLHGLRERHKMLKQISTNSLRINTSPRLVVFGFDDDQRRGRVWERHRDVLKRVLGRERVLLKGDSKDFRRGISS